MTRAAERKLVQAIHDTSGRYLAAGNFAERYITSREFVHAIEAFTAAAALSASRATGTANLDGRPAQSPGTPALVEGESPRRAERRTVVVHVPGGGR